MYALAPVAASAPRLLRRSAHEAACVARRPDEHRVELVRDSSVLFGVVMSQSPSPQNSNFPSASSRRRHGATRLHAHVVHRRQARPRSPRARVADSRVLEHAERSVLPPFAQLRIGAMRTTISRE